MAWRSWRLRPRVPGGAARAVSLRTTLLDSEVATPVGVAPWACQAMAHAEGERGSAEGPAAAGALLTVSASASTGLAEVAAVAPDAAQVVPAPPGALPPTPTTWPAARDAGYRARVLTADMPGHRR